ncbi:MAG: hypothetical protein JRN57_01715 [Nitrososphaerota archaeon]|nr:hypothetical protein [Nitrososphaerota archaeon]
MPKGKDVIVYEREKGAKLFLVAVRLEHRVGALTDLSSRIERAKFRFVSGFVGPEREGGYARCSWYVEATEGRPSKAEVKALLLTSPYVKDVEVAEAHKGMLVDALSFPLRWSTGDRAILIRTHFFEVMERAIRSLLSTGADVLLYQMGYNHGKPSWEDLLGAYKVDTREDLDEVIAIYSAVGWGKMEVSAFGKEAKRAAVEVHECFECTERSQEARTGCNFMRGHLAGLFATVFGDEGVRVTESKCVKDGASVCEFSVGS